MLSEEQIYINKLMNKVYKINYYGIFSEKLDSFFSIYAYLILFLLEEYIFLFIIFKSSKSISNCKEFLIPSLLTGAAHLMAYSKISIFNNFDKGVCMFSILIANPSTGKSPSIEKIKNALEKIEIFERVDGQNSTLVNGLINYLILFKVFTFLIIFLFSKLQLLKRLFRT